MTTSLNHLAQMLLAAFLMATLAACGSTAPTAESTQESSISPSHTVIDSTLEKDEDMEALIAPFREELRSEVETVIAHAPEELTEGTPEGTLGNLAADAMLHKARGLSDATVDIALTNNGGLRVPLGPGDITVAAVYELMPFENRLVVLTITGAEVVTLAEQLIEMYGGEPIAGFRFRYDPETGAVSDLEIDGAPVDTTRDYRLVTSDYLADGGGPPVLEGLPQEELPLLLRDAFLTYFENMGELTAEIEGRIKAIE